MDIFEIFQIFILCLLAKADKGVGVACALNPNPQSSGQECRDIDFM